MKKNVVLIGATGKMGLEASKMILENDQFNLVGAISASKHIGEDIGVLSRNAPSGQLISNDLGQILAQNQVNVVLDLTQIDAFEKNAELILSKGIPMVVGTTGLKAEDKTNFKNLAEKYTKSDYSAYTRIGNGTENTCACYHQCERLQGMLPTANGDSIMQTQK